MRALSLACYGLALLVMGWPARSAATECVPATGQSSCLDADTLWIRPGPTRFVGLTAVLADAPWSGAVALSLTGRSLAVNARSPDPLGREVAIVRQRLSALALAAWSPLPALRLDLVLTTVPYQSGNRLSGVTAQDGEPLATPVFGDVRLGGQYRALSWTSCDDATRFGLAARADIVFPTGNQRQFAGERGVVGAPSVAMELTRKVWFVGSEMGLRLRPAVPFGGLTFGHQLTSALGAGVRFLDNRLSVAAEAHIALGLVESERTFIDESRASTVNAPAQWLLSLSGRPIEDSPLELTAAGGSAIPLSSERRVAADGTETIEHFSGAPSARWRALFSVRVNGR